MSGNGKFHAKKQTNAGVHQGKWCVYRPDGIRLVVVESGRSDAYSIAYALRVAVAAYEKEGKGDWQKLLSDGGWK